MSAQTFEKALLVLLFVGTLFVILNAPTNPFLIDWIIPLTIGVLGLLWLIAYQNQQSQQ